MADKKISELTALGATPDDADVFAVVDTSAGETKKVAFPNLKKQTERYLFLPAYGYTDGALAAVVVYSSHLSVDAALKMSAFTFRVPSDFVSFVSMKAVWISSAASGNMCWLLNANYGASGESFMAHSDYPPIAVTATGGSGIINVQEPANALALANIAKGDYCGIVFGRDAINAADTLDASVYLLGLLFTYLAEQ